MNFTKAYAQIEDLQDGFKVIPHRKWGTDSFSWWSWNY